jgi:hypothetical protein
MGVACKEGTKIGLLVDTGKGHLKFFKDGSLESGKSYNPSQAQYVIVGVSGMITLTIT